MTDPDTRPAIVKFVERINRAGPGGHRPRSEAEPARRVADSVERRPALQDARDRTRMNAAAEHALTAYPGPVGELIHREVHAFLDFGYCCDGGGLAARLVDHVLATDLHPPPGRPGAVHTAASTR